MALESESAALAYEMLREQWRSGERDRELALHLSFLTWYLLVEPPQLTGAHEGRFPSGELSSSLRCTTGCCPMGRRRATPRASS
jgi:hypothetical protein